MTRRVGNPVAEWDGAAVRAWLNSRIVAARADQATAERRGREGQDDCDMAAAQEMICTALKGDATVSSQEAFTAALKALLDRDDLIWRGIYDDRRFDRHARSAIRQLLKMTKANAGFDNLARYQ
jgi:hypothetical protein